MEKTLVSPGGVTVHSYPNPALHSFCICLYVRGGCMYESDGENGITHLLEHVVFRNINHLHGGRLYRLLDRLGLDFNASTYKEFVRFSMIGAVAHFNEAAKILCQVLAPLTLPAEEIRLEKKRVKAEIREMDDKNSLDYFADGFVWGRTGLRNLITGKPSTVDAIGKNALEAYRRKLLDPANFFFYLTGSVTEENARTVLNLAEAYPTAGDGIQKENEAAVPADFSHRDCRIEVKNSQEHFLRFCFDLNTRDLDGAALNLLYDILFCGDSCKMFQELSEKSGLIYSYDARLEKYRNVGSLVFSFEVKPQDILPAAEKVVEILREMKEGIRDELELVRPAYTDNAGMLLDNAEELNWTRAYNGHILGEFYADEKARCEAYQKIKNADIDSASRRIFVPDNLVLAVKTQKKKLNLDALKKILAKL